MPKKWGLFLFSLNKYVYCVLFYRMYDTCTMVKDIFVI